MTQMTQNRWAAREEAFATRVEVSDLEGLFSKHLIVEPGVVALILENGQSIGAVPPGTYTLQTFADRLAFWTRRSVSAVLTRQDAVYLEMRCGDVPTREFLLVEIAVRIGVQIEDVALFQQNLLGSRATLTKEELMSVLQPIIRQALWEAVGRMSIQQLTSEQARGDLEILVIQALKMSLTRTGLAFSNIQTMSIAHPEYDAQRRRTGELWLRRHAQESEGAAVELAADRLLKSIEQQERTNELEILAAHVAADRLEGDLAVRIRRLGIRKSLREAILAGRFDKERVTVQLAAFQQEQAKEQLLREDEYKQLIEALKDQSTDKCAKREHLLRRLEIEEQYELAELRVDLDHAARVKALRHEADLAELSESTASRQWSERLKQEAEEANHRRAESLRQIEWQRQQTLVTAGGRRDEELVELQHRLQLDRINNDLELSQAQRSQRLVVLQVEATKVKEDAENELRQRKAQAERELEQNQVLSQLERLKLIQQLNVDFLRQQAELRGQERRLETELAVLRGANASQCEVARLQAIRDLSDLSLIASSDSENAGVLAEVVKHRDSQRTLRDIARSQSNAVSSNSIPGTQSGSTRPPSDGGEESQKK